MLVGVKMVLLGEGVSGDDPLLLGETTIGWVGALLLLSTMGLLISLFVVILVKSLFKLFIFLGLNSLDRLLLSGGCEESIQHEKRKNKTEKRSAEYYPDGTLYSLSRSSPILSLPSTKGI